MENIDLFDTPENLPENIQEILNKYAELDESYNNCRNLANELKPLSYGFDWGLDAIPYNLHKF